jgi:hypothetical protein
MPTHGSGPMRFATPSSQWTSTTYSLPVSTGAPVFLDFCTTWSVVSISLHSNPHLIGERTEPLYDRRCSWPEAMDSNPDPCDFAATEQRESELQTAIVTAREHEALTPRFDVVNFFDTIYQIRSGTGIGIFASQYEPWRRIFAGLSQTF